MLFFAFLHIYCHSIKKYLLFLPKWYLIFHCPNIIMAYIYKENTMNITDNFYKTIMKPLTKIIPDNTPVIFLFIFGTVIACTSFWISTILFRNGLYGIDIVLPPFVCLSFFFFECGNLKAVLTNGKNIIEEFIYFSLSILTQSFYIGTIFLIYGIEDKFFLLAVFFLFFLLAGIICLDRLQNKNEERFRHFNLTGFFLILFFSVANLVEPVRQFFSDILFTIADYDFTFMELFLVPVCFILIFFIYVSLRKIRDNKVSLFLFALLSLVFGFFTVYTGNLSFSLVSLIFYNWIYSLSVLKSLGRVSIQPFFDFICPVLLTIGFILEQTHIIYMLPVAVIASMAYLVTLSGLLIFLFLFRNRSFFLSKKFKNND